MRHIVIKTVFAKRTGRNDLSDVIRRLQAAAEISPNLIVYPDEQNNSLILADHQIDRPVLEILLS